LASRRLKPLRNSLDRAALEKILGNPCRGTVGEAPIQMIRAYSIIANGGRSVTPHL